MQDLLRYIESYAIDSEGNPIEPQEIPMVAELMIRQWLRHPLAKEIVRECLDELRFSCRV